MSKNAASALLRRLLAVRITKSLIQMVHVRESGLPAEVQVPSFKPAVYQHHIEPRLESIGFADSAWMRYLHGYPFSERAEG